MPDDAKDMQNLLYAAAHQGVSGHRGREVTLNHLRGRVRWTNMRHNVEKWRKSCLQCIKNAKGDTVPRPLGTQLIPEHAGEILMFDYLKIGPSKSGYFYVLVFADKLLIEGRPAGAHHYRFGDPSVQRDTGLGKPIRTPRVANFRRWTTFWESCFTSGGRKNGTRAPYISPSHIARGLTEQ